MVCSLVHDLGARPAIFAGQEPRSWKTGDLALRAEGFVTVCPTHGEVEPEFAAKINLGQVALGLDPGNSRFEPWAPSACPRGPGVGSLPRYGRGCRCN